MARFSTTLLVCGLLYVLSAPGARAAGNWANKAYKALHALQQKAGGFGYVRLSPQWGTIQILAHGFLAVPGATPEERARKFLSTYADIFAIPADLSGLQTLRVTQSVLGTHVTFVQTSGGFPVVGSELVVHMDKKGRVFRVTNGFVPNLTAPPGRITAMQAVAAVYAYLHKDPSPSDRPRVRRYVFATPTIQRPAWEVWLRAGVKPGIWQYFVDATNGNILQATNRKQNVNGTGTVFAPSPIKTLDNDTTKPFNRSTSPLTYASFPANNGTDYFTGPLARVYVPVVLQEISGIGGSTTTFGLVGPSVSITPTTMTRTSPFNFSVKRNDPNFVDVMAYYWIDTMARYINSVIGAGMPSGWSTSLSGFQVRSRVDRNVFVSAIEAQVHDVIQQPQDPTGKVCCVSGNEPVCAAAGGPGRCLQGPNQSFYDPAEPSLHYLSGNITDLSGNTITVGVPTAEDAEVILHEYAHAFQDGVEPGGCCQSVDALAMGEGFGDYQAAMFIQATGRAGRDAAAFAPWSNAPPTGPGGPLRRLDGDASFADDKNCGTACNEPHTRGQIWAAALWDIKNRLGLRVANRAIYLHHLLIPNGMDPGLTMDVAAQAVIDANAIADLGLGAAEIQAVFAQRGILPVIGADSFPGTPTFQSSRTISTRVVQLRFSEPLSQATVTLGRVRNGPATNTNCLAGQSQNFLITGPSGDHISATVAQVSPGVVNVNLQDSMRTDETPQVRVVEVADLVGNRLHCATATATDGVPPAVVSSAATSRTQLQITFSETLNASTINTSTFKISGNHNIVTAIASGAVVTLTISPALATGEIGIVSLRNPLTDTAGNALNPGIPLLLCR